MRIVAEVACACSACRWQSSLTNRFPRSSSRRRPRSRRSSRESRGTSAGRSPISRRSATHRSSGPDTVGGYRSFAPPQVRCALPPPAGDSRPGCHEQRGRPVPSASLPATRPAPRAHVSQTIRGGLSHHPAGPLAARDAAAMSHELLAVRSGTTRAIIDGRAPALYVMTMANGVSAKVGALEAARNAGTRLSDVQRDHRRREPEGSFPLSLVVVLEIVDLPIAGDHDVDSEERWAELEHLESALRLVLARRHGRLARWTDWIHLDTPMSTDQWVTSVREAWEEVCSLGRTARFGG